MKNKNKNEQELFWSGEFGNEYVKRSDGANKAKEQTVIANAIARYSRVFKNIEELRSVCEFGPNVGNNLKAIHTLFPNAKYSAVELNKLAIKYLEKISYIEALESSIVDFKSKRKWDLVFTSGVLIHIAPENLKKVYSNIYRCSKKYILFKEYFSSQPTELNYRGHEEKLWKRDFAGEFLDLYKDTRLVDYGFFYRRDRISYDDSNWFLIKKI